MLLYAFFFFVCVTFFNIIIFLCFLLVLLFIFLGCLETMSKKFKFWNSFLNLNQKYGNIYIYIYSCHSLFLNFWIGCYLTSNRKIIVNSKTLVQFFIFLSHLHYYRNLLEPCWLFSNKKLKKIHVIYRFVVKMLLYHNFNSLDKPMWKHHNSLQLSDPK